MTTRASSDTSAGFLLTERLLMRPPEAGDSAVIATLAADADPAAGSAQVDLADARAWIARARMTAGACTVAIVERKTGHYVGAAGMAPMADTPERREVGLWIGERFAGRGYATEAGHKLIDHIFGEGLAERLWCVVRVSNNRARQVIEKCGFQSRENGMARSVALRGTIPVERFVLERRTWLGLKNWGAFAGKEEHADFAA